MNLYATSMCKLISILLVNQNNPQENVLDPGVKYIQEKLMELNYSIRKISVVENDQKSISSEVEQGLRQSDFVVLIDKHKSNIVLTSVCDVFNTELISVQSVQQRKTKLGNIMVPKLTKILEYENSIQLIPVIYLGRLFIIREPNLKLVFKNILHIYLQKFNREWIFAKRLYFKDCDIEIDDNINKQCNCVELDYERKENITAVEIKSLDIALLVERQRNIKKKYEQAVLKEVYLLENVYDKNCFYHIRKAIECIEACLQEYGTENVFVSFNGGKDCTVLLHLVLGILRERYPDHNKRLLCMYIQSLNPFPEVNSFIDLLIHYYNLEIVTITKTVKEGLETFLEGRSNIKACLMGTRRSDPYSEHLNICQMTDPNWPQVMRVSPLLDWNYCEIWDYLLYFQVPYCKLYDRGYTSLGSINNTIKNPDLLYKVDSSHEEYLPAYRLLDGSKERNGRI